MHRLVTLTLGVLASCAGSPSAPPAATPSAPPTAPAATCPGDGVRWLASSPRVPLAIVGAAGRPAIADAAACCQAWAATGQRWRAVDRWGQPLPGDRVTTDAALYDVTSCWEQQLSLDEDHALLVQATGWTAPPSAAWQPSADEAAAFTAIASGVAAAFQTSPAWPALEARITYFTAPGARAGQPPRRFAVLASPLLLVAQLAPTGGAPTWRTIMTDSEALIGTSGSTELPYEVGAIVDLDGDQRPEIIVHRDYSDGWDDVVLGLQDDEPWASVDELAHSPGGATI